MPYQLITSNPSVKVYPGNVVTATVRAYCSSSPSGIGFVYEVPETSFTAGAVGGQAGPAGAALLDVIAQGIESCVTSHNVIGGNPAQDFDANGLLQDYPDLTVAYQPPNSVLPPATATAHIPVDAYFTAQTGIGGLLIPGL